MTLFRRKTQPRNIERPPGLVERILSVIRYMKPGYIEALPAFIEEAERRINRKLEKIMHTLDDLLAAVAGQRTQIDSLVALTRGLHQQVLDAMGSTMTPSQQDRIERVFAGITDNADALASAIKENTVEATAGAVSDGPSASEIKTSVAANPDQTTNAAEPPPPDATSPQT